MFIWSDGTKLKPEDNSPYFTNWFPYNQYNLLYNNMNNTHVHMSVNFNNDGDKYPHEFKWFPTCCSSQVKYLLCEFDKKWENI